MASCFSAAWAEQHSALQTLCASADCKARPQAPGRTRRVACGRPWQRIGNKGAAGKKCHTLAVEPGWPPATNGHMWMHSSLFIKLLGPSTVQLWDMVTCPYPSSFEKSSNCLQPSTKKNTELPHTGPTLGFQGGQGSSRTWKQHQLQV